MSTWSHAKLCSWVLNKTDDKFVTPNNEPPNQRMIEAEFGDRISTVARLVVDLNRDIGTHIVSEDLETILVNPGAKFEHNAMEKMWPDGARGSSESVVCATGLGLLKKAQNGRTVMMVMKPNVLVRSDLSQLME
ncbi:hypothetical protein C8R44DRAFT_856119 [Mycena epipterygia]|nr:hypothetical protein C8R44DRAFT_856119 [Mycena epipterygia]